MSSSETAVGRVNAPPTAIGGFLTLQQRSTVSFLLSLPEERIQRLL